MIQIAPTWPCRQSASYSKPVGSDGSHPGPTFLQDIAGDTAGLYKFSTPLPRVLYELQVATYSVASVYRDEKLSVLMLPYPRFVHSVCIRQLSEIKMQVYQSLLFVFYNANICFLQRY